MLDCSTVSGLLNKKSATMKHLFSQFFSRTLSCAFSCTHRCLLFAELLRRNTLRLSMLMLFVFAASINAWGQTTETVGITATLTDDSKNAGSESLLSPDHFTIEKVLGTNTEALSQHNGEVKPLKHGGSTSFYSNPSYKWNKNLSGFQTDAYVGYKVTVESGYQYNLTTLDVDLAVSANFTWKVVISDNAGNELYNTGDKTITNYDKSPSDDKSPSTNTTLSAVLSSTAELQNLTGDFYVKFYVYYNSTGKYFCFPKFTIQGNLVASSPSSPTYTITYNTNGGEPIAQVTNATALPNSLPTPTKEGYRFDRWYTDKALTIPAVAGATLSDNTTLYAKWKQLYTVTYDLNGGSGTAPTQESLCEGETFKVASAEGITKTCYTFAGWSDGSNTYAKGDTYIMGTADVILTAQWTALPVYTVTFQYNDEGATASTFEKCCKGDAVSLPTPTRTGYTFTGWYDAATGGTLIAEANAAEYTPTANTTLHAQWEVAPTCTDIAAATINATPSDMTASIGKVTVDGGQESNSYLKLSGDAKYIQLTAADGRAPFASGDVLYVTCYNNSNSAANRGFKIKNTTCTLSIAATSEGVVTYTLTSKDIETDGTIKLTRTGSEDRYKSVRVERCNSTPALPPCEAPNITTPPANQTVVSGNDATLTVVASGSGTLTYHWYTCQSDGSNPQPISGATKATYTVTPDAPGTTYYKVVVTGDCGTATSDVVSITATDGPCFSMTITKTSGSISGQTTLDASHATITGGTVFYARESGKTASFDNTKGFTFGGDVDSLRVTLAEGVVLAKNTTIKLTFTTNGTKRGIKLLAADNKTEIISIIHPTAETIKDTIITLTKDIQTNVFYIVRATSNTTYLKSIEISNCGAVCLEKKPVLTADKTTFCSGGGSVELTATNFTAGATLTLYKEGQAAHIEQVNTNNETSVTFTAVEVNATTNYYVVANNTCEVSSDPVLISVLPPANITKHPTDTVIWLSGKTKLAVEAEGAGTLTYQWYTCKSDGSNKQAIAGATAATYIVNPDEDGVTYYKVVVKDECSSTITSNVVSVTANILCGELIRATLTGATTADVTGAVAGSAEVNTQKDYKLGADGHFVGVSLKSGYIFQANDTVVINVTATSSFLRIYSDKGKTLLVESSSVTTGENRLVLPEEADGVKTLYLYRTDSKMNPTVSYMAVRRPCCNIPKIRWSAASAEIDFSDVSPELPTLSNTSGVPVSYSSDDTDVATIDENGVVSIKGAGTTSINAIYSATNATYCSHEVSYTLVVRCAVAPLIQKGNSVGSGCNEQVELTAVRSDNSSDYGSGSFQWYRNGVAINGAKNKTYTANQIGTYTVSYSPDGVDCSQMSTNKAVVTSSVPQPVVEKKAPHRNYQIAKRDLREYTSATHYPLFDVTPKATAGYTGEKWEATYSIHAANTGIITAGKATIDWVREDATGSTISLGANYEQLSTWLSTNGFGEKNVGDTIMLTVRTINSCNEWDNATADSIPIILTDKYSLAYIVTGNTTTRKFYDITASDIADPLYTQLRTKYNVTPVSAYATYDYTNYEPYDLLLLTDYPKATGTNAQPDYVNALADLVDKKPILSLKAHMSKLSNWSAKGFTSDPVVPGDGTEEQAQKTLTVLCFSHDMFAGAQWDNADDRTLTILNNVYKDSKAYKGIQGFLAINSANFVNIAKVYDAKGDRNLVACCERQDVTKARFIMLSINQGATKYINPAGQDAIDKLLKYLLWTDAANVSDCSLTFDNGDGDCQDCSGGKREFIKDGKTYTSGDHQWNNPANWNAKAIPTQLQNVRIEADCKVSGNTYGAGNVRIKEGNTLTIAPNGGLASVGQFAYYSGNNWNQPQPITNTGYITVQANAEKTGMLMHSHTDQLAATVEMYSPAYYEGGKVTDGHERIWSYVAIPVQEGTVPQIFNGAYTYLWSEKEGWIRYNDGYTFDAFDGIALSQPLPQTFTFAGNLALAQKYEFTLTNTKNSTMKGMNLIGNSWTAPIQITKLKDTDFGKGLEATVYIYSTGRDPKNGPATTATEGDFAAGYWTAIPIETAKTQDWDGPTIIPAMQAFEVNFATDATTTSATLTLDYNTIVRASGVDYSTLNQKLYAPGRNSTAEILQPDPSAPAPYEPTMLRIRVADTAACYNLHLLQGERFSEGFDNGWDGFYTGTDGRAPGLCALTTAGEMQVSAQPEIDNTTLVFTPGRSNTYTFSFCLTETEDEPLAQPLYLNDMQLRKSCLIDDSHTYTFQSSENDMENRFVISHIAFEEQDTPTGIANLATVDQQLMLSNPAREALTIRVYDPAGRLCSEMSTREAMLQITLPEPQGVYMIHITGEHTEILRKIVQ